MKYSSIFKKQIGCNNEKEVFAYLISNLNDSIRYWDYFVNWKKVIGNTKDLEVDLNILNYLIGKENIEKEFGYLLKKHPQVVRLIPILLACREHNFKILTDLSEGNLKYEDFSFEE
ncbi:MAG: DpnII family type II restriction endonuclease, partial [Nitrospirota bacterium]|nr:DpnII family type II restriction endonuclease [Nitrospirota bacterium]